MTEAGLFLFSVFYFSAHSNIILTVNLNGLCPWYHPYPLLSKWIIETKNKKRKGIPPPKTQTKRILLCITFRELDLIPQIWSQLWSWESLKTLSQQAEQFGSTLWSAVCRAGIFCSSTWKKVWKMGLDAVRCEWIKKSICHVVKVTHSIIFTYFLEPNT